MPTINQLSAVDQINDGDQFPLYSPNAGDARKASFTTVKESLADDFASLADLAAQTGAGLVGTSNGTTVQQALDSKPTATLDTDGTLAANSDGRVASQKATKTYVDAYKSAVAASSGSSLAGFIQSGAGAVAETAQTALRRFVFADQFGAVFNGVTDDTANIQKAFDAVGNAGGGTIYFPANKTAGISQSIIVWSNTTVVMNGATVRALNPGWVGTNASLNCFIFRNKNYSAGSLTDQNITFQGPGYIDYNGVTVVGGGAHMIAMRYVNNVTVRDIRGEDGENVTAFLACRDTLTENCEGLNQLNCYFDHWDGAGYAKVIGCTGRNTGGNPIAQGIQFTGTGSALEDRTSTDAVVIGNYLEGVRDTGSSSAIIANANDVGSATYRMISMGNTVKDCDLGLVFEGVGGQHVSIGDTFVEVDGLPIFIKAFSGGGAASSNCRVINPHLIDCDHDPGNIAMISVAGAGNSVRGIKVTNTGAAAYGSIATVVTGATNTIIEIESAATGSAARVVDSGTNSTVIDGLASVAAAQTAWTAYTPTVTAGSGSFTTVSATGRYKQIGKTIHFRLTVNITTNGTAASNVKATLPVTAQAANATFGTGREATAGILLDWFAADTTNAFIVTNGGAYPGADGRQLSISGTYEAA